MDVPPGGLPAADSVDDFQSITLCEHLFGVIATRHDFLIKFHRQAFARDPFFYQVVSDATGFGEADGLLINGNRNQWRKLGAITLKSGIRAANSWPSSVTI